MHSLLLQLWRDETGQDLIEYALLVALVATGSAILMPMSVQHTMSGIYSKVNSCLVRFSTH
jgi:Flp pilus assembly pilin Flp